MSVKLPRPSKNFNGLRHKKVRKRKSLLSTTQYAAKWPSSSVTVCIYLITCSAQLLQMWKMARTKRGGKKGMNIFTDQKTNSFMAVTTAGVLEPALTLRISGKVQKRYSDISCLTSWSFSSLFISLLLLPPPPFFFSPLLKYPGSTS